MATWRVLWLTERSTRHQQAVLEAAPPSLKVNIHSHNEAHLLGDTLADADFVISERRGQIDADFVKQAKNLKLIVRLGSLVDDIDLAALKEAGIRLSLQPVLGSIMVAEHCLMMILALLKRMNQSHYQALHSPLTQAPARTDENTFRYNWSSMENVGGLYDKRVSIIGMGEIGLELARRLQAFRVHRILYYKRHAYPLNVERELGLTYSSTLENAFSAEVVVALLPYSPETQNLLDIQAFARMPRGSVLVQTGSGGTLDETMLAKALRSGHLGGAALDTFAYEPLPLESPLRALAQDPTMNLILSPHVAASTQLKGRKDDYQEILRFIDHTPLEYEIRL